MKFFNFVSKILLYTFILLGICNSSYSKINDFNYDAKNISNYFSGIVSFSDFDYTDSYKFFKKINHFEIVNENYSSKLIQSLVNLEKYHEAYLYAKKMEKENLSNFESNLLLGLSEFKKDNYIRAEFYFDKLEPNFENKLIFGLLKKSLNNWLEIAKSKDKKNIKLIEEMSSNYNNFALIQKAFASCHFDTGSTEKEFQNIIKNEEQNFSRYHFFFANYFFNKNNILGAKKVVRNALQVYPGNLLIKQFEKTLNSEEKNKNEFNCKDTKDIVAEIFYVIANALSSTGNYGLSNFYINLSKYLNPKFLSFESLIGENFLVLKKYDNAKIIYKKLSGIGSVYKWYSSKQIANILRIQNKKEEAISFLSKIYYKNTNPNVYQTYDLGNYLRNDEKYEESIKLYSTVLSKIEEDHPLYPKVLDRRGMAYERMKNWNLAEKDLLNSLEIFPNEPYVMNYLAYSWVERGENINKALNMLKKANNLKKNDGYITDSLGWALYKLRNFSEAKKYLQMAITIMPDDPVVNDHFADCLWMNNKKIQARYYWNYVLNLESAESELKKTVEKKLLFGLEKI
tara:strand:+ start:4442 stop:6148 length:1707 start_codon:yes stop_codon:yes gene_type:complete